MRKSKEDINRIKDDLLKIMGRLLIRDISTRDVFKELGFDYNNMYDRNFIYYMVQICRDEADQLWTEFETVSGDMSLIYKKWLDACYLNKKAYFYFENSIAFCPKTYEEDQRILAKIATQKIFGTGTALRRLADRDMMIGDATAKALLGMVDGITKLLPDKEEEDDT